MTSSRTARPRSGFRPDVRDVPLEVIIGVAVIVVLISIPGAVLVSLRRRRLRFARINRIALSQLGGSDVARECPICGHVCADFEPVGPDDQPDAGCPKCGSRAGDRLLCLYTLNETDLFGGSGDKRVLRMDQGPAWREPADADRIQFVHAPRESIDAAGELALSGELFDVAYCSGPSLGRAEARIAELYRILRPGGWAVVFVSAMGKVPADQAELLARAGFQVTVDPYPRRVASSCAGRFGLHGGDKLYFCAKPGSGEPGYVQHLMTEAPGLSDPAPVPGARPVTAGRVEEVRDGAVLGWAWDPTQPDRPVPVSVVVDGRRVAGGLAGLDRPSLARAGVGDGRHVFRVELPTWVSGAAFRRLRVEPEDGAPLPAASGFKTTTPRQSKVWGATEFAVEGYAFGRVEAVGDGVVTGWVWSPESPVWCLGVKILVDGAPVAAGIADKPREGLGAEGLDPGRRDFRVKLPDGLPAGTHSLRVEIDERRRRQLGSGDRGVALLPSATLRTAVDEAPAVWGDMELEVDSSVLGRVESVQDRAVAGWAWDSAGPRRRVGLRIIIDGRNVGATVADLEHTSLRRAGIGDGRHGFHFELPEKLADVGRHGLRVEAEDGAPLPGTASFTTIAGGEAVRPNGMPGTGSVLGRVLRVHNGTVIGWAWALDSPGAPLPIRVMLDGEEVGAGLADRQRTGGAESGKGRLEFRLPLSRAPTKAGPHLLRVEADGGVPLSASADFTTVAGPGDTEWRDVDFVVDGAVVGRVESVGNGFVSGWAWRPQAPAWRVGVRVLLDGAEVCAGLADLERPSLIRAGIGDGLHGFRFELPLPRGRARHRLRVEAEDVPLPGATGFAVLSDREPQARAPDLRVDGSVSQDESSPVVGCIEQIAAGTVSGWVWSPSAPDWRLWVRLIVDGEDASGAFADLYLPRLADLGLGDGRYGFSFELPKAAVEGTSHYLRVEAGHGVALPVGVAFVSDPDDPWRIVVSPARYR